MRYLILFLFIFIPFFIEAQIINIENNRIKTGKDGIAGRVKGYANYIKNTNESYTLGLSSHVQYKKNIHFYLLYGNISFVNAGGFNFDDKGFVHLRYNIKVYNRIKMEAFAQNQFDHIMKVKERVLIGGGPRFKLINTPKDEFKLYFAPLYMYEYIETNDEPIERTTRLSTYVSFTINLSKLNNIKLIHTTYYQPKTSDLYDYKIFSQTVFKIKITQKLYFDFSLDYMHDSRPPKGVPENTIYLRNGLQFVF